MTAGTRLVLIGERSAGLPIQALREAARLPSFRWAATLYGGARFVAALEDDVDAERLRQAVAAGGGDTALSVVSDLMDAVELTRYLDAVAGPAAPTLERGS
jgi:hypothetical protein